MEADAELHTPQLNRLGIPDGMTEYSIRTSIRDLAKLYGAKRAREIATEILKEETERRQ